VGAARSSSPATACQASELPTTDEGSTRCSRGDCLRGADRELRQRRTRVNRQETYSLDIVHQTQRRPRVLSGHQPRGRLACCPFRLGRQHDGRHRDIGSSPSSHVGQYGESGDALSPRSLPRARGQPETLPRQPPRARRRCPDEIAPQVHRRQECPDPTAQLARYPPGGRLVRARSRWEPIGPGACSSASPTRRVKGGERQIMVSLLGGSARRLPGQVTASPPSRCSSTGSYPPRHRTIPAPGAGPIYARRPSLCHRAAPQALRPHAPSPACEATEEAEGLTRPAHRLALPGTTQGRPAPTAGSGSAAGGSDDASSPRPRCQASGRLEAAGGTSSAQPSWTSNPLTPCRTIHPSHDAVGIATIYHQKLRRREVKRKCQTELRSNTIYLKDYVITLH
jgi:hypothetical protein